MARGGTGKEIFSGRIAGRVLPARARRLLPGQESASARIDTYDLV